ncbi:MAG: hypothetical protein ACI4TT_01760 [Christensenellales bacterium]
MEDFIKCNLEFEDFELNSLVTSLNFCFDKQRDCFVYICRDIYKIWKYCKSNYWKAKDNEYYNSYKLLAKFGFDKKAVSRYKLCYEKFVVDNDQTLSLAIPFLEFTSSKLFEMLSLTKETAFELIDKKVITPKMTVKQIREIVKTLKNGTDKAEKVIEDTSINEDDIPMAYDPRQEYEYSYFETKTKNQLLNIVWELQKEYQKLKNNKEKKQK